MRDELIQYYEDELRFIRKLGAAFADEHGDAARRLRLERETETPDPHVERLLEGFAFLAARIHLKIDDDFPQISEALLSSIYPHHIRPFPSATTAAFQLDPAQGKLETGYAVPRDTKLLTRDRLEGVPCSFRTCYDATLWPIAVDTIEWMTPDRLQLPARSARASWALRVELGCFPDNSFAELQLTNLCFFLGSVSEVSVTLYELLCNNCVRIVVRDPSGAKDPIQLSPSAIEPMGFAREEAVLPVTARTFPAYGWLQEYFIFPEKFMFFRLNGLERLRAAGFGSSAEIVFLFSSFDNSERADVLDASVSKTTLRLGCTPIVNLFEQRSEPTTVTHKKHRYLLLPDARRRRTTEIFSVDKVIASDGTRTPPVFEPFYSLRHNSGTEPRVYWYAKREQTKYEPDRHRGQKQNFALTNIYLSFADIGAEPVHLSIESVEADVTCFNGALARELPADAQFDRVGGGPVLEITALRKPTAVVYPTLGKASLWRLVSQLSLNHVSLVDGGAEGIRELLRIHDPGLTSGAEHQIQGVVGIQSEPWYSRIESEHGLTFARGHRVELEFDEDRYANSGFFLLASVLEQFLGLSAAMNSFSVLAVKTRQRQDIVKQWPPRSGRKVLV